MAHDQGKTVGIVVDDDTKTERMLKRVIRVAMDHGFDIHESNIKRLDGAIYVVIGKGEVRVIAGDRL